MTPTFKWFGFSVPRKHVYFYGALLAATITANCAKDALLGSAEGQKAAVRAAQVKSQIVEAELDMRTLP
jgi:hypothetical protein